MCVQSVQVLNITTYGLYNMQLLCIKASNICLYRATLCDSRSRQRAESINSLTMTLHKPLIHCKCPLMET